jgi:hypothetical protein
LDALIEESPRYLSPRIDSNGSSAATSPRARELQKESSNEMDSATREELDKISKDIERLESEKSVLMQELLSTLEKESKAEKVRPPSSSFSLGCDTSVGGERTVEEKERHSFTR